jgi:hypothetical protein
MAAGRKNAGAALNVLFVGNSFTARNDLPGLIAGLAAAAGASLSHRLVSAGGASLRMHWNKGEASTAIRQGGFDYVVLQEQSTLPIKNAARFHENVRLFDAAIKAAGSTTALYMTWARSHAPEAQQALTDAYQSIGRETGAAVVPVGTAWQRFLAKHDAPVLHDADGSHPTPAGSYLAACVFFAVLWGRSPVGVGDGIGDGARGPSPAETKRLQQAAWDAVR